MANPKIQLRHDTSTNWQTQNPVLLEGEVAIETDSNKVKIGNGIDNYNTLPYVTDQTKINLDYSNADYQPANKDLNNLAEVGNNRLHSLKGYGDTGELLTDVEGLTDIKSYAHSTFDRSKFAVVGSPTITDDGIASGFSSSNYITTSNIDFSKPFEIKNSFILSQDATSTSYDNYLFTTVSSRYFAVAITNGLKFNIRIGNGSSSWVSTHTIDSYTCVVGVKYYVKLTYDLFSFKFFVSIDNNSFTEILDVPYTFTYPSSENIGIGQLAVTHTAAFHGSIDLKQFSITVDGKEVFNGNKEGLDVIKPDDYTVVGSPTITEDGMLVCTDYSNPSTRTNYVDTIPVGTLANSSFVVECTVYPKNYVIGRNTMLYSLGIERTAGVSLDANLSAITFWCSPGTSTSYQDQLRYSYTANLQQYDVIKTWFEYKRNEGKYYFYASFDNGEKTLLGTQTPTVENHDLYNINVAPSRLIRIGASWSQADCIYPIDLNAFKIYVDGQLVYQPCLKIPYTESKTGSKIVNSIYRDRVNDMAEQFGYANYYTIDEDNGNFTLPQVELFGLIGGKTLRDSYYNGATYWELFSNRRLEQGGSCESGVEYTLPRPFADANYTLTIPYTSKTATSFIPSATGDFIAKGTGLL